MIEGNYAPRPQISLPELTRESVRQLVESDSAYLREAGAVGRNVHQLSLDRRDQVAHFISTLDEEELKKFTSFYTQETQAMAQKILDDAARMSVRVAAVNLQAAKNAGKVGKWMSIIVFFIVLIGFIRMMR